MSGMGPNSERMKRGVHASLPIRVMIQLAKNTRHTPRETLENPGFPRDNGAVIAGQD